MFDVLINSMSLVAASDNGEGVEVLRFFGRLHPLVLHFPIALSITAACVEGVNILRRKPTASEFAFVATGLAAGFGIVAALFGWFMADFEGAGPETTLFLHRWLGVISAGALVIVFLCGIAGRTGRRIAALNGYRWGLLLSALLVTIAAYFGGEMVWGEGYFTKVLSSGDASVEKVETPEAVTPTNDEPDAFTMTVAPIFQARCVECHGPEKAKGDLRLDSAAAIFQGDEKAWSVIPGDAAASLLVERIELPATDPDVMPAKGEVLTAEEIAVIKAWINDGAVYNNVAADVAAIEPGPEPEPEPEPKENTAFKEAVDALQARGVIAMPIAQDTDEWQVTASFATPAFDDEAIGMLSALEGKLAWLNLARTKVGDQGMAAVGALANVRDLRLDNTTVGDAGVEALVGLTNLETLNLYGTQVSDTGVAKIAALPSLKKLYCDGTKVTAEGIKALQAQFPSVVISGPAAPPPAAEEVKPTE